MHSLATYTLSAAVLWMLCAPAVRGQAEAKKYLLRYKPQQGQVLRWQVEHRAKVRTTINGTTQTSETASDSVKVWEITDVRPDGQFTLEHRVEKVVMREKTSGRAESVYNSETDEEPPPGFAGVAKNVGVPLARLTLDAQGGVVARKNLAENVAEQSGEFTIPLPRDPIPVGGKWSLPHTIVVQRKDRQPMQIKAVQRFTLDDVTGHVATISMNTAILTAVTDPFIESQLMQRERQGTLRFDIELGRIIEQKQELEKRVVGHIGESSSMQYTMSYLEVLLPDQAVAKKPEVAPAR